MEVEFADDELDRLEVDRRFTAGHDGGVVKAFRKVMQAIRAAPDERDFMRLRACASKNSKARERINDQCG